MVNRDGECRLVVVAVVHHHLRKVETFAQRLAHRHTYQSLGYARHEVDILCSSKLSRTDEVALILTVGVVYHKYALTLTECIKSFFYCIEIVHIHFNIKSR